jgi:protein-S-isoprenylcysteine O-methyltransferase Ste14
MEMSSLSSIESKQGAMAFIQRRRQALVDLYIFLTIAVWIVWNTYQTWTQGRMGYVETAFALQNSIFLTLILVRRQHRGLDKSLVHQAVAAVAFFSGLAFMGQPLTGGHTAQMVSKGVTLAANILGILALANLGRSFGVLIAFRKIQTRGLYSLVRHPMYLSDILFRVGFITTHFNGLTSTLFVVSSACYVYRALLEEKFLGQQPEYREYMNRVKRRFVPFVF